MDFYKIDLEHWPRKEYFHHYYYEAPCTYSMTVDLDISRLLSRVKSAGIKLYPVLLYCIASVVNQYENFKIQMKNGELLVYDHVNPSYTIFHPETETFSVIWTAYDSDFQAFYQAYQADQAAYGAQPGFAPKPKDRENYFDISCVPWVHFSAFDLRLQNGYDYLAPIFTIGQYQKSHGRTIIPLSMQIHHAVCDGFHAARFYQVLQDMLNC